MKKSYFYADGQILAQRQHPVPTDPNIFDQQFYVHDRLGSVRMVVDYNDVDAYAFVVNSYTYTPFGSFYDGELAETVDNPFKFAGQWHDVEIGQYYLRARQYDPAMMRFTSRDPVKGIYKEPLTLHRYLYCQNNSINSTDPSGRMLNPAVALYAEAALYAIGTMIVIEAVWQNNDKLFDAGMAIITAIPNVLHHAWNKYGEMKGGKQKDRDRDLWKFKDNFKGDPDRWRKFREFVEQRMGEEGRDGTKIELHELYEEFMNGGY